MLKKSMAIVLAVVMTLALAIPAFATGSSDVGAVANPSSGFNASSAKTDGDVTVNYTSVTRVPYLNITIAGRGAVILNPYQIKYTGTSAGNTGFDSATDFTLGSSGDNGQIISAPLTLTSKTQAPVQVGVSIKTTITQGVQANANDKNKAVVLSATKPTEQEMGTASGKPNTSTSKKVCMWICADEDEAKAMAVDPFDTKWKTEEFKPFLILSETVQGKTDPENKKLYKIPVTDGTDSTKKTCCLMFNGAMIPEPVDNPWVTGDKITPVVTISLNVMKIAAAAAGS